MSKHIILPKLILTKSVTDGLSREHIRALDVLVSNTHRMYTCYYHDLELINMNYTGKIAFSLKNFRVGIFYAKQYGINWLQRGSETTISTDTLYVVLIKYNSRASMNRASMNRVYKLWSYEIFSSCGEFLGIFLWCEKGDDDFHAPASVPFIDISTMEPITKDIIVTKSITDAIPKERLCGFPFVDIPRVDIPYTKPIIKNIILPQLILTKSLTDNLSNEALRAMNVLASNMHIMHQCYYNDLEFINMNYTNKIAFSLKKFRISIFYAKKYGIMWRQSGAKTTISTDTLCVVLIKYNPKLSTKRVYKLWLYEIFSPGGEFLGTFLWCEKGDDNIHLPTASVPIIDISTMEPVTKDITLTQSVTTILPKELLCSANIPDSLPFVDISTMKPVIKNIILPQIIFNKSSVDDILQIIFD